MNDGLTGLKLLRAVRFAAEKHRDQRRKGEDASPYINHPISVAGILAESGVTDPIVLEAAILHDTIEDTETSPDELAEKFGQEVVDVVLEVTDDKSLPKQSRAASRLPGMDQARRRRMPGSARGVGAALRRGARRRTAKARPVTSPGGRIRPSHGHEGRDWRERSPGDIVAHAEPADEPRPPDPGGARVPAPTPAP